ncbi:hypothetical protein GCM10029976_032260 [Kribbella albertanoniae]|uniref:ImmA/IrrE family metallo-endopeptidase n=1 Tax=Kribbella albertanoniae TaxID=1266829 RepID=A0A4R4QIN9_9ACTN|nr:hypothetical protein [Kribbella albertanoniae]TDC35544.1 hypothetical protein E1261_01390 [Kribbella albertanoniae]
MSRLRVSSDDLRRVFEAEVGGRLSAGQWVRWLDAASVLRGQSFRNVVLIRLQMPEATWVDGREPWQERGRMVARGEAGIRVLTPMEKAAGGRGASRRHDVATVWDISQTDGRDVVLPPAVSAVEVMYALAKVAGELGYGVRWGESADGIVSRVDRRRRQIVLSPGLDPRGAAGRIAHELAHLRMHKLPSGSGCCGLVELEADSVAYAVLARYGCVVDRSTSERLAAVASVVGSRPPARLIDAIGGRVVTAAGRLAGAAERHMESKAVPMRVRSTRVETDVQERSAEQDLGLSL